MFKLKSKLAGSSTTIFTVMSSLAQQYDAINLGQGFPDFEMDEELINLVNHSMKGGRNQYVHMNGLPVLRDRIAEKVEFLYGTVIDPATEITITPGGTYALFTALTCMLEAGDEVIYFEPAYDSYTASIIINGAVPVPIKMNFPDYKIDWDEVVVKVNNKTKAIIINSPHNPTGTVLTGEDIQRLIAITKDTGIIILSDEVYEHIIFDNIKHLSVLKYPELRERSFVCFSFGKTYHCTGWKLGYIISPEELMNEFRKIHQFNCFTCNSPVQYGFAEYLGRKEKYLELGNELQKKRDYFKTLMDGSGFRPLPSSGSYFQLYDYSAISDESEMEFAKTITRDFGVTAIPVSAFYTDGMDNKVLRFCFVKKDSTLEEASSRLHKL